MNHLANTIFRTKKNRIKIRAPVPEQHRQTDKNKHTNKIITPLYLVGE